MLELLQEGLRLSGGRKKWERDARACRTALAPLTDAPLAKGELHPVAPRSYPLTDVAEALTDQLERRVVGKSVLVP